MRLKTIITNIEKLKLRRAMIYHLRYMRDNKILFTNKYKTKRTLRTGINLNTPTGQFKLLNSERGMNDTLELFIPLMGFTATITPNCFDRVFKDVDKLVMLDAAS